MSSLKISDYVDVDSIDGTELILVSKDGSYRKTTIEEIRNLASDITNTELANLVGKAASAQDVKKILTNVNAQLSDIVLNTKTYGAKGDGTTDDTTVIKNAIAHAVANNKDLFFPDGNYLLSDYVFIPATVKVRYAQHATFTSGMLIDTKNESLKFKDVAISLGKIPTTMNFNNTERYNFDLIFYVPDSTDNMQGLTYYDGYFYIGFDMGSGYGKIVQYTSGGLLVKDSGNLQIGHSAELAYRKSNDHVYACNGGGTNPTFVYEIDMTATTPSIINTLNYNSLGNSALIAIDNDRDLLIVHTATSDTADPTFSVCKFDGTILHQFTLTNQGVPQGLDYYQNQLYFYTDNKISVLDYNGNVISSIPIVKSGESEGLCIAGDYSAPYIAIGYNASNRLYALRSLENKEYHTLSPMGCINRRDASNISLMPKYLCLAFNTNNGAGVWNPVTWINGQYFDTLISSYSLSTTALIIVLKQPFSSGGFWSVNGNANLTSNGIIPTIDLATDGVTLTIQFIKVSTNTIVDPNTIPITCTIRMIIFGGVRVNN